MKNRGKKWFMSALLSVLSLGSGCADTATTARGKSRPVADAGSDQKILVGVPVQLDGQRSYSPSGEDLSFQWEILALSDGMADLRDGRTASPTLTIYQESTCLVQLVVEDTMRESVPDIVQLLARRGAAEDPPTPPVDNPPVDTPPAHQDGDPCDDGDPCTSQSTWQAAQCVSGAFDLDLDGDGAVESSCPGGTDCDDGDATVRPGATELCDAKDNNCDGVVAQEEKDVDQDGYVACSGWADPTGEHPAIIAGGDCNDSSKEINPGAAEGGYQTASCRDGLDNNCDGKLDYQDAGCKPDPSEYKCKKRITIDHARVAGTNALQGFPLYFYLLDKKIKFPDPGTCLQSSSVNGIAFVNLEGAPLAHEIETYDPGTGTLIAWVRLPAVSPTTDVQFYLLIGGPVSELPVENPGEVWGTAHRAVWHLNEPNEVATHADSTANHADATREGNARDKGFLDLGSGQKLDGTNKQIRVKHHKALEFGGRFAVSMWVKWSGAEAPAGYLKLISNKEAWNSATGFAISTNQNDNNNVSVLCASGAALNLTNCIADGWKAKTWHHIGVVFQGVNVTGICDGKTVATGVLLSSLPDSTRDLTIGKMEVDPTSFKGLLDEVQLSTVSNPVEWIQTQFANQSDPAKFYTMVDE